MARGGPSPAREAMLKAGRQLLDELPLAVLLGGLSVSSVSRRAKVTRATFYHHWPQVDDYLADLLPDAFANRPAPARSLGQNLPGLISPSSDILDGIRRTAQGGLASMMAIPGDRLRLLLASRAEEPPAHAALAIHYQQTDTYVESANDAVFGLWGVSPRPPFDRTRLAVAFTALADGLHLRHLVDPEFDISGLYGDLVIALLPAVLRDPQDPDDLDRHSAVLRDFASPRPPTARAEQAPREGPVDRGLADALIHAALSLLDHTAWADLSMAEIARAARVSEATALHLFGSKAGLGAIVLGEVAARDIGKVAPDGGELHDLRAVLVAIRASFARNRALARAAISVAAGNAPPPGVDALADRRTAAPLLRDRIVAAQAAGVVTQRLDADALSRFWARSLLIDQLDENVSGTNEPPNDVVELLLAGAVTPS